MIIGIDEEDAINIQTFKPKIITYSPISKFESKRYFERFRTNIEFKNFKALVKIYNKLKDL